MHEVKIKKYRGGSDGRVFASHARDTGSTTGGSKFQLLKQVVKAPVPNARQEK